jgi:hypothetical protein
MINPSKQTYCETMCPCNPGGSGPFFELRRNDTCPAMEIVVKGKNGEPVDLTGWTAEATMFLIRSVYVDVEDDADTIQLESVAGIRAGDVLRVESEEDEREKLLVTDVDRDGDVLTVTRGHDSTTAAAIPADTAVYDVLVDDIPVEIELETLDEQQASYYQVSVGDVEEDETIVSSKLVVRWRASDTSRPGDFLVQVEMTNDETGEKITLPRGSSGYLVRVRRDANDD